MPLSFRRFFLFRWGFLLLFGWRFLLGRGFSFSIFNIRSFSLLRLSFLVQSYHPGRQFPFLRGFLFWGAGEPKANFLLVILTLGLLLTGVAGKGGGGGAKANSGESAMMD